MVLVGIGRGRSLLSSKNATATAVEGSDFLRLWVISYLCSVRISRSWAGRISLILFSTIAS
jgi:hypothetical protein